MIHMNDFRAEPAELKEQQLQAFERVMNSGWYILGPEVKRFEAEWAKACNVRRCVGVANGLDAIEIGLRASKIGAGAEVITTPMTAFASVLAILRAGAIPVLADIDPETGLLDRESVRRCIGPRTKGILLVHLYGQLRDMDKWVQLCQEYKIQLFEDCAQAHLSQAQGKHAGSFGSWGAYSFYPTKNLGALGDAGAWVSNDEQLAVQAEQLRNYGQSQRYHHPVLGLNSRLDEIQAALLQVRLAWLESFTAKRRQIADTYYRELKNSEVTLLARPQELLNHCYHLFVLRCDRRDSLAEHLKGKGIEALIHYPLAIHHQEPTRDLRQDPRGLPHVASHAATCLSIPCHPFMSESELEQVISGINSFTR